MCTFGKGDCFQSTKIALIGLLFDHPVVRLVDCHHAENGLKHENGFGCPIVITSKVKPFSRLDNTRTED